MSLPKSPCEGQALEPYPRRRHHHPVRGGRRRQRDRDREAKLAGGLDRHVAARQGTLDRIRKRVPFTPEEYGRSVKSPQIRGERFEGWGIERLLAALDACGYEAVIAVRPKPAA